MRASTQEFEKTLEVLSQGDLKQEPWEEWEGFQGRARFSKSGRLSESFGDLEDLGDLDNV